jgi:hypothetical protein
MKLTKKEKKILIKELANRCKDIVYMQAKKHAEIVVEDLKHKSYDARKTGDELILHYDIKMCIGDILQIVGRHRRKRRSPLDKS